MYFSSLLAITVFLGFLPFSNSEKMIFEIGFEDNEDFLFLKEIEVHEKDLVMFQNNTLASISSPSNSSQPKPRLVKKIAVIVTAYSSTPWETWGDPFITASGSTVRKGIVANNLLPFGTELRLPEIYGEKIFVVEDRMNSRKGPYHVDIWFPSYSEAVNFGVKTTYIEILEN